MHLKAVFPSLIISAGLLATSTTSFAKGRGGGGNWHGGNHGGGNWHGSVSRHYGGSWHGGGYWQDRDHDGHYNFKHYDYDHHHGYYPYYYPYYGGYYGWYRPYSWYPWSTVGLSYYGSGSRYARYSYGDSLAVDVQRALRSRGYYRGRIDGEIGSGSRSAIRNYQRDHGLGVSGRIDTALLRSLRVG